MTVLTPAALDHTLAPLRQGFEADGADLVVVEAAGTSVKLRLVITENACAECILPSSILVDVLRSAVVHDFPDVTDVALDDPRV